MPVSSLDYLLVDAKDDLHLDFDFGLFVGDDSQNFGRLENDSKINMSKASLETDSVENTHRSIQDLSFLQSQRDGISRAEMWANFLGLDDKNRPFPHESKAPATEKTSPDRSSEKRGKLSGTAAEAFCDHDLFSLNDLPPHKDEPQVMRDVKRLFTVMSQCNSFHLIGQSSYAAILSAEDIEAMRKRLYCLIIRVLRKYPCLHYYQGFHDIASVVLLVSNEACDNPNETAFRILETLTLIHLRDFMIQDISLTINHLKLVLLITETTDPEMFELITNTNATFAATGGAYYDYKFLPGLLAVLTLFSHDMTNTHQLLKVWDFILGHGSVTICAYVYVALLRHCKREIFEKLGLESSLIFEVVDLDLAHSLLSPCNLVSDLSDADLEIVLEDAGHLLTSHPLESLPNAHNTYDVWFKEFNTDSVVLNSSRPIQVPFARIHRPVLPDPARMAVLIKRQERQQLDESAHESGLLQDAFDQIDSLSTSINSTFDDGMASKLSLMSSLMSFMTVSSSLNNTMINSSSNLLRKIAPFDSNGSDEGGNESNWCSTLSIYRLSLTIGFVGFLLHFLLKQTEFGSTLRLPPATFFHVASRQVNALSEVNFFRLAHQIGSVVDNVRECGPIRDMAEVTQVGLGSLKRSLYSMAFL